MSVGAACPPVESPSVRVEGDLDAAVALMTVCGRWGRPMREAAVAAMRRCLAGHPEALIVDLSRLDDPGAESVTTWVTAQHAAAGVQPPVHLALCVPPDLPLAGRMQRLAAGRYLPVYAKVRQARVAIAGRVPATDRLTLTLPPEPESPSLARTLVADACLAWELAGLLHPARLVMSELVTNAVEHAGTTITVGVSLRGAGIHLFVSDGEPAPPRLRTLALPRPGRALDERGRGLRLVAATASAWGSLPTATGKIVWATLQKATGPR